MRVTSAIGVIAEQVRQRVRREGVDLHGDRELAARYVRDEVQRYAELALGGSVPLLDDEQHVARQVVAALTGLGPLQPYLEDPSVEELWINAPDDALLDSTTDSPTRRLLSTSAARFRMEGCPSLGRVDNLVARDSDHDIACGVSHAASSRMA